MGQWRPVRYGRNNETDQAGERYAVEEDEAEDVAFAAVTFGGCGGDDDTLWSDHLAHDASG